MYNFTNISLYIHFPWCIKKCFYCDFNSHKTKKNSNGMYKKYLNNIFFDFNKNIFLLKNKKVKTIFIGGGTPSLLNIKLINLLINKIKNRINLCKNAEITIEINPETINFKKLYEYKIIGINRLSFGIQSFNINHLKRLGRTHDNDQAIHVINLAKKLFFKNINIDLMYGLPNQTIDQAMNDLKIAIDLNPTHISWYQLTIEKNTIFNYKKPKNIPNEDIIYKIFKQGNILLDKNQYKRYEISSYSKKKFFCKHNLNYWKFGDYIGIGCGAHSKITHNNKILRIHKTNNPHVFMQGNYISKIYLVKDKDKTFEFFMNKFRLIEPIKKQDYYKYTGLNIKNINSKIKKSVLQGFLSENNNYWIVTNKGLNFLNLLLENFL